MDEHDEYLQWIKGIIKDPRGWMLPVHVKLIDKLYTTEFLVQDENDRPRENDGYDLRWRFIWDKYYPMHYDVVVPNIREGKCSILEMMVALSLRMDENFEIPVSDIFWIMVKNMGLLGETDNVYDDENVVEILDKFNNRMYEPNGHGSLFYIRDTDEDMRNISIWDQLCRWVNRNQ